MESEERQKRAVRAVHQFGTGSMGCLASTCNVSIFKSTLVTHLPIGGLG